MKREGPPQLQFVIATDPSQFRDENAKRSVRSQAMIHWRHEENKKKSKISQEGDFVPAVPATIGGAGAGPPLAPAIPDRACHLKCTQTALESPEITYGQLSIGSATSVGSADECQLAGTGSSSWQLTAIDNTPYFPKSGDQMRALADQAVTEYEESERHEERQLRAMIGGLATFYNIGCSYDPFDVLPQFRNRRLDALYLSRNCKSYLTFGSVA